MAISTTDVVASLTAPLCAPALFALIAMVRQPDFLGAHSSWPLIGTVMLLSYTSFAVFGIPAIVMLRYFKVCTPVTLGATAFAAGIAVQYLFYRYFGLVYLSENFDYTELLWGGMHGFCVGMLFFMIINQQQRRQTRT